MADALWIEGVDTGPMPTHGRAVVRLTATRETSCGCGSTALRREWDDGGALIECVCGRCDFEGPDRG